MGFWDIASCCFRFPLLLAETGFGSKSVSSRAVDHFDPLQRPPPRDRKTTADSMNNFLPIEIVKVAAYNVHLSLLDR